jgi:PTH1 family peptidyl-tRNA hydrolase
MQDFDQGQRVDMDIAIQEGIDAIKAVLVLGMDKAVSGVRMDAAGRAITPAAHQNGKGLKSSEGKPKKDMAEAKRQKTEQKQQQQQQQQKGDEEKGVQLEPTTAFATAMKKAAAAAAAEQTT